MLTACARYNNPTVKIDEAPPPPQPAASSGQPADSIDDVDITLEVIHVSLDELVLLLTNNTSLEIAYDDGYSLSLIVDGQLTNFGSAAMGFARFTLPPGEQSEIRFDGEHHLWPGEFRFAKYVTAGLQQHELYVEFAVPDDTISADMDRFIVDVSLADPMGAVLVLTNGSQYGRMYFDRHYRLLQNLDGSWQDVPETATRFFPDEVHYVAPQQTRRVVKNWGWLHGALESGEYRIEKSFWYHSDEMAPHDFYIDFTIDGDPEPHPYIWGYNPFEGAATFRGEVLEADDYHRWHPDAILVRQLTPMWDNDLGVGGRSFINPNEYMAVLDTEGEPILLSDITPGNIVDVTFSGMVLESDPAIIGGGILIQVIE